MTQREKWKYRFDLSRLGIFWTFILPLARWKAKRKYRRTGKIQWLFELEYGFVVLDIEGFKYYNRIRYRHGVLRLKPRVATTDQTNSDVRACQSESAGTGALIITGSFLTG